MAKIFAKLDKFTGLHCSSDGRTELEDGEAPIMNNFKITPGYKLRTRDGYTVLSRFDGGIRGMISRDAPPFFAAAAGDTVYVSDEGFESMESVGTVAGEGDVSFFEFGGELYLLDGEKIRRVSSSGLSAVEPYVPTVMISTLPSGTGTLFESPNALTRKVRQRFTPDGESPSFVLCSPASSVEKVEINGEEVPAEGYSFDGETGSVVFSSPPAASFPDAVTVTFTRSGGAPCGAERCRFAVSYGGGNDTRAFFWGDPENPACRYFCGVVGGKGDLSYFPEENYTVVGDGEPINVIMRHYDRMLIFTKRKAYYSLAEQKTDAAGRAYTSFPVYTLSDTAGSDLCAPGVMADNFPYTLSGGKLCRWTSTNVRDERNALCVSDRINEELSSLASSRARLMHRRSGRELFISAGEGTVFVYSYALDVFYRYTGLDMTHMTEKDGKTFFALSDGSICAAGGKNDGGKAIKAEWYSKYFDFGKPEKEKNVLRLDLSVFPDVSTYSEISWATDRSSHTGREGGSALFVGYELADFSKLSFDALSFDTSYAAKNLSLRTRVRRFGFIRIALTNEKKDSSFHLVSLSMTGTY